MPKKINVKVSWNINEPLKMAGFARGIVRAMSDNNYFTSPPITLTALEIAASDTEDNWATRMNGAVAKDMFTNANARLFNMLHSLADYVSNIADGNTTIIHSGGWENTHSNTANKSLQTTATTPVLASERNGIIKAKTMGKKGNKMYCFILVLDGDFNVTIKNGMIIVPRDTIAYTIYSTKRYVTFFNLPPMKIVKVAVIVFNSNGDSIVSPVASGATLI